MDAPKMDYMEWLNRLRECERYFTREVYSGVLKSSLALFEAGRFEECAQELNKLPSSAELLERLVKKLKGKSIGRTLEKIQEGKSKDNLIMAKALFSLGTHIMIECEHGNSEYRILLPNLLEKISEIIYSLGRGDSNES